MRSQRLFRNEIFLTTIVVLLGFFSWYSYYRTQEMIDSSERVNHSNLITLKIEEVLSHVKDAETAQRGYIITKDSQYLQPAIGALQKTTGSLNTLDSLLQDNEQQTRNFYTYKLLTVGRLQQLEKLRRLLPGRDSLQYYLMAGKMLMDSARRQASLMEKAEQKLLIERIEKNQSNTFITPILTFSLSLLLLFIVIMSFLAIRDRYVELAGIRMELSEKNQRLEQTANDLKASEEKFRGLLEHAPDAVVIASNQGTIQIVNMQTEEMFGYKREELIGKKIEVLIPERLEKIHAQHRKDYFADPKFREMGTDLELKAKRKDGSEFPVEVSLSPLKTKDSILVSASVRDISRRKKMEEDLKRTNRELRHSNAQLESFNYIASHDLKEPLRKIRLFSGKILESEDGRISDKGQDYFRRIENSALRMQELIESLFSYSTLGKEGLEFTTVDLNAIVAEVAKNRSDMMAKKQLVIHSEKLPMVVADRIQMYELFSNLIDNSVKYKKENVPAVISIIVEKTKGDELENPGKKGMFWKISFIDNGIGFDSSYSEKIFELFKRLHGTQDYPGTGIGLAICKRVIENHHGFIMAESTPGKGASFHIYLPETTPDEP